MKTYESPRGIEPIVIRVGRKHPDSPPNVANALEIYTSSIDALFVSTNSLWTLKKKKTLHLNHTWAKSTLSHFVPLVNALKEVDPSRAPEGVPRNATQFTTADPFVPRPDSSTQMRKLFCVTSVVQTTAESCTLSDSFSWLIDARTRMLLELENTWGNCTVLQWSRLGDTTVKLTFPCCRRLCPKMKIVEQWVMGQLARWNGSSFRFGQKLFSVNWPLCVVPNYFFQQDGTIVKRSANF